jgi:transcriptional regulator with XRE-family HTH domain
MIRIADPSRFGLVVKDLRAMHMLSQRALCAEVGGLTQARLSDWETGKAVPTLPLLIPLLAYFDHDLALIPREDA